MSPADTPPNSSSVVGQSGPVLCGFAGDAVPEISEIAFSALTDAVLDRVFENAATTPPDDVPDAAMRFGFEKIRVVNCKRPMRRKG